MCVSFTYKISISNHATSWWTIISRMPDLIGFLNRYKMAYIQCSVFSIHCQSIHPPSPIITDILTLSVTWHLLVHILLCIAYKASAFVGHHRHHHRRKLFLTGFLTIFNSQSTKYIIYYMLVGIYGFYVWLFTLLHKVYNM